MLPTREELFQKMGTKDFALAGSILKQLTKSQELNGEQFISRLLSELNQPYETGYYKGKNSWQRLGEVSRNAPYGAKFGMWKKVYTEASLRIEWKPIDKEVDAVMEKFLNSGIGESFT